MNKKKNNKYINETPLDDYEKELEDFLKKGKYRSTKNFKATKKMLEEAAKRHIELQETKSVTLRLNKKDLIKIKARAKRRNLPYQTLIGLLINQYVEKDRTVAV